MLDNGDRESFTCFGLYNLQPDTVDELRAMSRVLAFMRLAEAAIAFVAMALYASVLDMARDMQDALVDGSTAYFLINESISTLWFCVVLCLLVSIFSTFTVVHFYFAANAGAPLGNFRIGVIKFNWVFDFIFVFCLIAAFAASLASVIQSESFSILVGRTDTKVVSSVNAALSLVFVLFIITLAALPMTYTMWKDQRLLYTAGGGPVSSAHL
ncbi:Hypothetical Protein FCC1311_068782 [Hondaea fermentalgiana]|uniref:Uncharacterized protein n=1 Tax=Hondaea fermentalgiana TaxID=2315210 RepID=A0A2R5GLP1_9STRA|nr:Hypothetical Protein FCC1311_068782 [Hondaea fermentalgiana]|eukprot:GBG30658.1 Hypothetical Protein FCC1311_068782 [Hondaea fermentalgiana]